MLNLFMAALKVHGIFATLFFPSYLSSVMFICMYVQYVCPIIIIFTGWAVTVTVTAELLFATGKLYIHLIETTPLCGSRSADTHAPKLCRSISQIDTCTQKYLWCSATVPVHMY
jgi:peptidoglycan biosynthesis protein MviN/MurJ (putative lipid II flippase)